MAKAAELTVKVSEIPEMIVRLTLMRELTEFYEDYLFNRSD